jgi:hypothetical protein
MDSCMQLVCISPGAPLSGPQTSLTHHSQRTWHVLIVSGVNNVTLTTVPARLGFPPILLHFDAGLLFALS